EGDLVPLVANVELDYVTLLGQLPAILVRPFPEAPELHALASRLAMIEDVGAAFNLHVADVQIRVAAEGVNHVIQDLERLLLARIFHRSELRGRPVGGSCGSARLPCGGGRLGQGRRGEQEREEE